MSVAVQIDIIAYQLLAEMLNALELGAPLPDQTLHARAAYLANDAGVLGDPLGYGVLLIMPFIYRRWAATHTSKLPSAHPRICKSRDVRRSGRHVSGRSLV